MNCQDLNQRVSMILNMANKGMNPQSVMQQMFGANIGSSDQIQLAQTQLTNMANGRPMNEFLLQALKQGGLNEENAKGLARLLGIK